MTATLIFGIDFGGKKAKEQENITETLREMGRQSHIAADDRWNPPGTADQNGVPRAEE